MAQETRSQQEAETFGALCEKFHVDQGSVTLRGICCIPTVQSCDCVVILSHEFGMNILSTARFARGLCLLGVKVYLFDFSGSGKGLSQGRKSSDMSVLTEKEDLAAVFSYVRSVEPGKRIALGGCSMGGLVAALFAQEHAEEVDRLFLLYPALCIPDDSRRGEMLGTHFDLEHLPRVMTVLNYIKVGRDYLLEAAKLDPWEQICSFPGPVLIMHGGKDHIVPCSYSERAAKEYQNASLRILPAADHGFQRPEECQSAVDEIYRFLTDEASLSI